MGRLALLFGLVFLAAACGSDEPSQQGAASNPVTSTASSNDEPAASGSPAELSGDGRYFGYVRAAKQEPRVIVFDVAQAFSGEAANRAAAEDGVVESGEPVPNDHYERNPAQDVEMLEVAPGASVTAAWPASFLMQYVSRGTYRKCERGAGPMPCTQVPLSLDSFFAATKDLSADRGIPVWLTIDGSQVVRIDEQYFP
jgi:hypothetical protein